MLTVADFVPMGDKTFFYFPFQSYEGRGGIGGGWGGVGVNKTWFVTSKKVKSFISEKNREWSLFFP